MPTVAAAGTGRMLASICMNRRLLLLNLAATLWCGCLLLYRIVLAHSLGYIFLVWNLFLAAIPLALSLALRPDSTPRQSFALLSIWLLFFPNAPYVLTDLIHLNGHLRHSAPQWLDLVLLLSFAFVSLSLGFQSLRQVQRWVSLRWNPQVGWCTTVAVLGLSGFGVYLGRFLRWNSWDILHRPHKLLGDVFSRLVDPFHHGQTWGFTLGFGGLLVMAYSFWFLAAESCPPPVQISQSRPTTLE